MAYYGKWVSTQNQILIAEEELKVELYLSNYATKSEMKKATNVDTSEFGKNFDLSILKSKIDELDVDELKSVPSDLSELSNVVETDVVK